MTIDPSTLFRLDGRTAIITGGTRGIGLAIAEGFAATGARVVVASRKADACQRVAADLVDRGYEALGVPCHVGELHDVRRLVDATVERFGGIDVLVNNAANALAEPIGSFTEAGFDKSMAVNVRGPVFLTEAALPHLSASGHGSIINIVSAGAFMFSNMVTIYAAAKATMVSYTKSWAGELARHGVRVNALAPGAVDTDMLNAAGPEGAAHLASAALLRRAASPDEMVGPALLLASDAGSFITGSVLHVDGGLVSR